MKSKNKQIAVIGAGAWGTAIANVISNNIEQVKKDTDRDNYLSAKEAVEYGLIDRIVEKRGQSGASS